MLKIKHNMTLHLLLLTFMIHAPLHAATGSQSQEKKRVRDTEHAATMAEPAAAATYDAEAPTIDNSAIAEAVLSAIRGEDSAALTTCCSTTPKEILITIQLPHPTDKTVLISPLKYITTAFPPAERKPIVSKMAIILLKAYSNASDTVIEPVDLILQNPEIDEETRYQLFVLILGVDKAVEEELKIMLKKLHDAVDVEKNIETLLQLGNPTLLKDNSILLLILAGIMLLASEQALPIDEMLRDKLFKEFIAAGCSEEQKTSAIGQYICNKFLCNTRPISAEDFDILWAEALDGNATCLGKEKDIPLHIAIDNILTSALLAHDTNDELKTQINAFFAKPVVQSPERTITMREHLSSRSKAWEASQTPSATLLSPEKIALAHSRLPAPVVDKPTITVIPIPALLQSSPIGKALYKDSASSTWSKSCSFYAIFHLVNLWQYRDNPAALKERLGRNNFSTFLSLTRSAADLVPMLRAPEALPCTLILDDEKRSRKKATYPTLTKHLDTAATIPLGGNSLTDALLTSYSFLSDVSDQSLHYAPVVATTGLAWRGDIPCIDGLRFGITYCNANGDHNTEHTAYLKAAIAKPEAFVFPVCIETPKHMSSGLAYKITDIPGQPKQFYVFFAESNNTPGHENNESSTKPVSSKKSGAFHFATLFQQLFASLTDTPSRNDVAVLGPEETFQGDDAFCLLESCRRQVTSPEQVYTWRCPSEDIAHIEAAIIDHDSPLLDRLCDQYAASGIDLNTIRINRNVRGVMSAQSVSCSVLGIAVLEDNAQAVKVLCSHGATPQLAAPLQFTDNVADAFSLAIYHRKCKALQALCQYASAEINRISVDDFERPTAHVALLMKLHKSPEMADTTYETLLITMAQALLDHRADLSATEHLFKRTLFHFALEEHYFNLFEILCQYPQAKDVINQSDSFGHSTLYNILDNRSINEEQRYNLTKMALDAGAYYDESLQQEVKHRTQIKFWRLEPRLIELLQDHAH